MPSLPLFAIERDPKLMKDKSSRSYYRSGSYQSSNSSNSKYISKSSTVLTKRKYHADSKVEYNRRSTCYDDENGHSEGRNRHRADSKISENTEPRNSEYNKSDKDRVSRRSPSPWSSNKRFRRSRSPSERKDRKARDNHNRRSRSRSPSLRIPIKRRQDSYEDETDEESQRKSSKGKQRRSPSPIPSSSSQRSHHVSSTVSLSSFPSSSLYVNTEKIVARDPKFSYLPIEWWDRSEDCREAKTAHVAKIDSLCSSRESLVLNTTLWKEDPALEQNMFPCKFCNLSSDSNIVDPFPSLSFLIDETPPGIVHYTLWSKDELTKPQVRVIFYASSC